MFYETCRVEGGVEALEWPSGAAMAEEEVPIRMASKHITTWGRRHFVSNGGHTTQD